MGDGKADNALQRQAGLKEGSRCGSRPPDSPPDSPPDTTRVQLMVEDCVHNGTGISNVRGKLPLVTAHGSLNLCAAIIEGPRRHDAYWQNT